MDDPAGGPPEPRPRPSRAEWAVAALLLLGGAALRYAFVFHLSPPSDSVFSDMAGFVNRAQNVLDHRFPREDTLFPPGEHLLLAASGRLLHGYDTLVLWAHVAAGVLSCYWVWRGSILLLGRIGGLAALTACAFHFPFIALSGYYLAETVFSALLALLFCLCARPFPWSPRRAFGIGAVAALGTVWKGSSLLFLPLLAMWVAMWYRRRGDTHARAVARCGISLLGGCALVIGAQTGYFGRLYGVPLPVAAGGAYNFALDKCPGSRIVGRDGTTFESPRTVYTGESGVQIHSHYFYEQAYFWRAGAECVGRRPWVVLTSLGNVYYLFYGNELWPVNMGRFATLSRSYQRIFALLLFPGLAMAVVLLGRAPFSPSAVPFLIGASVCASSWIFLGELRYRVPFDVVFIPMGILGWTSGLGTLGLSRPVR